MTLREFTTTINYADFLYDYLYDACEIRLENEAECRIHMDEDGNYTVFNTEGEIETLKWRGEEILEAEVLSADICYGARKTFIILKTK